MNGVQRTFLKTTKEDFYQKELEHIGQQPIFKGEIFLTGAGGTDRFDTWAYQDRYREYRETPSFVAGEYRSLLDYWHMARDLPSNVELNDDFVACVPTKRIHNVQTTNALWCMVNNNVVARRLVKRNASGRIL